MFTKMNHVLRRLLPTAAPAEVAVGRLIVSQRHRHHAPPINFASTSQCPTSAAAGSVGRISWPVTRIPPERLDHAFHRAAVRVIREPGSQSAGSGAGNAVTWSTWDRSSLLPRCDTSLSV